jgi:2,3,4,5-tetrahydropyridine-2-carboxylate N-succinyltransferase
VTDTQTLAATIDAAWEDRASLSVSTKGAVRDAVEEALAALDGGKQRVAERDVGGQWTVNQWLKKAVLLSFRLNPNVRISNGPGDGAWWDKVPSKFSGWSDKEFSDARFRAVPGAVVRRGAYVAPDAVLMPSFTNIGAYVGEGTMVDTWTTVGSCAQIGKQCHLSGGVGIGGVLEPLQANPVIIEDNCFVGARSEVAEGVIVREGSVIGMGVYLGQSTPIVHRETGETLYGEVPPYSVVVAGNRPSTKTMPGQNWAPSLYCAVIVKQVDAGTRSKTSVNELLRT